MPETGKEILAFLLHFSSGQAGPSPAGSKTGPRLHQPGARFDRRAPWSCTGSMVGASVCNLQISESASFSFNPSTSSPVQTASETPSDRASFHILGSEGT